MSLLYHHLLSLQQTFVSQGSHWVSVRVPKWNHWHLRTKIQWVDDPWHSWDLAAFSQLTGTCWGGEDHRPVSGHWFLLVLGINNSAELFCSSWAELGACMPCPHDWGLWSSSLLFPFPRRDYFTPLNASSLNVHSAVFSRQTAVLLAQGFR